MNPAWPLAISRCYFPFYFWDFKKYPDKTSLKEKQLNLASSSIGIVHRDEESMVVEQESGWSHCICAESTADGTRV